MRAWEARALPLGDTRARPNASTTPAINARNHPHPFKTQSPFSLNGSLPPFGRTAPLPSNIATPNGWRRRCSTVPRFPADAAVIVAGRTRGASVLRPRRRSAEQRLASLESNGAQCILQCLTMAIKLRHVFSRRPLTEITPLSGNTSPPCIQNELVLARFARRVSK